LTSKIGNGAASENHKKSKIYQNNSYISRWSLFYYNEHITLINSLYRIVAILLDQVGS